MSTIDFQIVEHDTTWTATAHIAELHTEVSATTPQRAAVGAVSALISKTHQAHQKRDRNATITGVLPAVVTVPDMVGHLDDMNDPATARNVQRIATAGIIWHVGRTGTAPRHDTNIAETVSVPPEPSLQDVRTIPWAVLDIEKASNGPDTKIVEIAIRRYLNGELVDTFHTFINPQRPLTGNDLIGHNVREQHVADAPTFEQVADIIDAALNGCVIVGHALTNDIKVLHDEFNRIGQRFAHRTTFDTHQLWKQIRWCPKGSLQAVAEHFGIVPKGRSHFAAVDAETAAEVAFACVNNPATPASSLQVGNTSGPFNTTLPAGIVRLTHGTQPAV
jgi:DNA polymerase III epsilon subunit-like protein